MNGLKEELFLLLLIIIMHPLLYPFIGKTLSPPPTNTHRWNPFAWLRLRLVTVHIKRLSVCFLCILLSGSSCRLIAFLAFNVVFNCIVLMVHKGERFKGMHFNVCVVFSFHTAQRYLPPCVFREETSIISFGYRDHTWVLLQIVQFVVFQFRLLQKLLWFLSVHFMFEK